MKAIREFVKTTVVGGLVFLAPPILLVLVPQASARRLSGAGANAGVLVNPSL